MGEAPKGGGGITAFGAGETLICRGGATGRGHRTP